MNELPEVPNPQRIWPILWRGKWLILASVVLMVGLAIAYTKHQTKQYEATGIIQVNLPSSQPGSQDTTAANQGLAQNYAKLLVSSGFINSIRSSIDGGRLTTDDIQSRLTATAVPQTALVQLQATGSSPEEAQTIARRVLNGFLSSLTTAAAGRTKQEQGLLQQTIDGLDTQIAALSAQPRTPAVTARISSLQSTRNAVIAQNASLVANGVAQQTAASVSAAPVASTSPVSPKVSLNVIAGLLAGLLLGVGLAYAREALRSGIRSAEDAAAATNLPVLASIPLRPRKPGEYPAVREAYAVLNTNLMFSLQVTEAKIVAVVGFNPQVGKTSVVLGVAEVSTRSDRTVLLVDGDMRSPMMSKRLGYGGRPGFVELIQGTVDLDQVLVELRPGLFLLPTQQSPVNPATLLSTDRMHEISRQWRERFDVVLIDTPPLSGLADGLILSSLADLVVLVARVNLTKPDELVSATKSLSQAGRPIAGLVVFDEVSPELKYPYAQDSQARRDPAQAH